MSDYQRTEADTPIAALRAAFDRDGYVVIPRLLDPNQVGRVRERVYRVATEAGWASGTVGDRLLADPDFVDGVDADSFYPVFHSIYRDEDLHRLAHASPLLETITRLMKLPDTEVFVHPQKVLRWTWPASQSSNPGPHQDFPELQGSLRQLTAWIPLHDVTPEQGALPLYRGSHTRGVHPLRLADNPSGWEANLAADAAPDIGALSAGDVIIFSTLTVHGGSRNDDSTYRISIDARYQPVSDPLCESALTLPGYPYGWGEVCDHWTADLRRYWEHVPLRVVKHDPRWENWRERESLRLGALGDPVATSALRVVASQAADERTRLAAMDLLATLEPVTYR